MRHCPQGIVQNQTSSCPRACMESFRSVLLGILVSLAAFWSRTTLSVSLNIETIQKGAYQMFNGVGFVDIYFWDAFAYYVWTGVHHVDLNWTLFNNCEVLIDTLNYTINNIIIIVIYLLADLVELIRVWQVLKSTLPNISGFRDCLLFFTWFIMTIYYTYLCFDTGTDMNQIVI